MPSVHILEFVVRDLAVDTHGFGWRVGIISQGHERGDAVVDSVGGSIGKGDEEGTGKGEWRAEDNGMNVLSTKLTV